MSEKRTAVIDGDMVVWRSAFASEQEIKWDDDIWTLQTDMNEMKSIVDETIDYIQTQTDTDDYQMVFSDSRNFRYDIFPEYKANRKGKRKPLGIKAVKEWCYKKRNGYHKHNLEADDVIGMMCCGKKHMVAVSGDKDFGTLNCEWFNFLKAEFEFDNCHADTKYASTSLERIAVNWLQCRTAERSPRYYRWFEKTFNCMPDKANIPISKNNFIEDQYKKLGPFSSKEKITMIILLLTIFLWLSKKSINSALSINLTDSSIALFGSLLFFIIPYERYNFVLNKSWFKEIPWNILILFGGGLSLASSINSSGLANLISESLFVFSELEIYLIIILMALLISFMTEITSNTATTLLFLPIVASFASKFNYDLVLLCLPIIISASCAFMMPIATPPNAIIFSTNQIKITFMVRIGFVMNCTAVILSSIWIFYFSFLIR